MKSIIFCLLIASSFSHAQVDLPLDMKISRACSAIRAPFVHMANDAIEHLSSLSPLDFNADDLDFDNPDNEDKVKLVEERNRIKSLVYTASEAQGQIQILCSQLVNDFSEEKETPFFTSALKAVDLIESVGKYDLNTDLSFVGKKSSDVFKGRTAAFKQLREFVSPK